MRLIGIRVVDLLAKKYIYLLHGLLFLTTSLVISSTDVLVFTDYADYLGRIFIYNNLPENIVMSEFYERDMQITPYLGFFAIVSSLEPYLGIMNAGKVYIIFAMFVILTGGIFLNRVIHGGVTGLSLLLHVFMFNVILSMGFVNFYLGIGLILYGIGFWVKYTEIRVSKKIEFYALFAVYGLLVYFCHIFSLFLLGVFIGLYEIFYQKNQNFSGFIRAGFRAFFKVLSFTLIPMILTPYLVIIDMGLPTYTGSYSFAEYLRTFLAPLYLLGLKSSAFVIVCLLVLLTLKVLYLKKFNKVVLLLLILALITPFYFLGIAYANVRLPVLIAFIVIASISIKPNIKTPDKVFISIFIIASFLYYFASLYRINVCSEQGNEYIEAFEGDANFEGKKLLTVLVKGSPDCGSVGYDHISSLVVTKANMYVPDMITGIPPVRVKDKYDDIDTKMSGPVRYSDFLKPYEFLKKREAEIGIELDYNFVVYAKNWREDFDFITIFHFGEALTDLPEEITKYKEGSFFTIYKNNKKGPS